jgi:hypothetical protein
VAGENDDLLEEPFGSRGGSLEGRGAGRPSADGPGADEQSFPSDREHAFHEPPVGPIRILDDDDLAAPRGSRIRSVRPDRKDVAVP